MVDFDDQTLRKHHAVLSWGMPQPACPGCHQFPSSTPKIHFCEVLRCNLATARPSCPFCDHLPEGVFGEVATTTTLRLDTALAEAEARAREAEERRRLAEEAARKEIELRVEAERKAHEIEKKVTRELVHPQSSIPYPGLANNAGELVQAKIDAEARARKAEELRMQAEAAVIKEAEKRTVAEQKAKDLAQMYINNLPPPRSKTDIASKKDKVAIALYAAIATFLLLAFVVLIITMVRLYYS
jgi:hypothetical protein